MDVKARGCGILMCNDGTREHPHRTICSAITKAEYNAICIALLLTVKPNPLKLSSLKRGKTSRSCLLLTSSAVHVLHALFNMPPSALRSHFLLSIVLHVLVCQGAWVRKFRCGSTHSSGSADSPFWIDSLRGTFDTSDASPVLSLSLLGVHNASEFTCNDLNLTDFVTHLRFHVLGLPVGQVDSFTSQCPLPITEALTP
jgi:hypothetical protein